VFKVVMSGPDEGKLFTVAGTGFAGGAGDGGQATGAQLNNPRGVAIDATGTNLYISEFFGNRVRRVHLPSGIITRIAGTAAGSACPSPIGPCGDEGPATAAELNTPRGLAVDASGTNLYIATAGNNRIRKVDLVTGTITRFAGTGNGAACPDRVVAMAVRRRRRRSGVLSTSPSTPRGTSFIADSANNRVRKVSGGIITTVAGTGPAGAAGDLGPATSAQLRTPRGIAVDVSGNLYISDTFNHRIRKVVPGSGGMDGLVPNQPSAAPLPWRSWWAPAGVAIPDERITTIVNQTQEPRASMGTSMSSRIRAWRRPRRSTCRGGVAVDAGGNNPTSATSAITASGKSRQG
jgi:DNA-binding beta-propeller fold protein YncE